MNAFKNYRRISTKNYKNHRKIYNEQSNRFSQNRFEQLVEMAFSHSMDLCSGGVVGLASPSLSPFIQFLVISLLFPMSLEIKQFSHSKQMPLAAASSRLGKTYRESSSKCENTPANLKNETMLTDLLAIHVWEPMEGI